MSDWFLEGLLPLPRPEYSKQPEALLADLLWRSGGSSLDQAVSGNQNYFDLLDGNQRLVFSRRFRPNPNSVSTRPIAERADLAALVEGVSGDLVPVILNSITAPRSRGSLSDACVPILGASAALQTLHGIVNKENPANLAEAIEVMGSLGGGKAKGQVGASFLRALAPRYSEPDGLVGLLDLCLPTIAAHVWLNLPAAANAGSWPPWPLVVPVESQGPVKHLVRAPRASPFFWFWSKWISLCEDGWVDALSPRRWIDWSLCLLRTALAFAYLWEAEFYERVSLAINEAVRNESQEFRIALIDFLDRGTTIAKIEPLNVPASQKDAWRALSRKLSAGYRVRSHLQSRAESLGGMPAGDDFVTVIKGWLERLDTELASRLQLPKAGPDDSAVNTREFVRYLLLSRSANDDSPDQADFYYLMRTTASSRYSWFEPAPEWLVVVTSLLSGRPGGSCTLAQVVSDLSALGIRVDRPVLIGLLEQCGLTSDSPDADDALIVTSGF